MSELPEIGKISPEVFNELIFPCLGAKTPGEAGGGKESGKT